MNTITNVVRNSVRIIKFNKPNKKNAVSQIEFHEISKILKNEANTKSTNLCVLTGSGNYFTSGLDFSDVCTRIKTNNNYSDELSASVKDLIEQIINFPKLLIAIVNGPAIGIGTTILPLCDYVYASEKAIFQSPFVKLGINAEACSSLTFPKIMGKSKATDLIFLGNKMTVQEAHKLGLVGKIYNDETLDSIYEEIENIAKLPIDTVKINKKLITDNDREALLECNKRETDMLQKTFKSKEFLDALDTFLARKQKKM